MTAPRRALLLTADEAIGLTVVALDAVSAVLCVRLPVKTVAALLHERPSRRQLSKSERAAIAKYGRALAGVRMAGHGGLIADQVEGYVSALESDPGFRSQAA